MNTFQPAESPATRGTSNGVEIEDNYRLHRRFDRMGRLVGDTRMKKLLASHVLVVGLGGVGSWAAEAIVRAGVGKITIVDFDEICITNANRQLHALTGMVGKQKSDVMAERLRKINPQAVVRELATFYNQDSHAEVFAERPDVVIDAIDNITNKCFLIAHCRENGIPLVVSTGSAGRLDPTRVEVSDLADTQIDPLASSIRRILRQQYAFPSEGKKFGVTAIFSREAVMQPEELRYDNGQGFKCVCPQGKDSPFNCDNRNLILGSAGFVTGAFGFACAAEAVKVIIRD